MKRPVSVGIIVLALALAGVCGPVMALGVGAADASGDHHASTPSAESIAAANDVESQDFDSTTFEIEVHENGSATWTFRHELRLDDDDERNFETFAEEFEEEETGLYERFTDQAEALTETGKEMTDREMEATTFNRSASVEYRPSAMGVVEMSFVWIDFADTEDDQLVVGDVFRNMYISDQQSIVIKPDDGYAFAEADPEGEYTGNTMENASSMTWSGEREFLDGHPRVVLQDPDEIGSDSGTGSANSSESGDGLLSWSLLAGLAAITLGAAAAVWYRNRQSPGDETGTPAVASIGSEPDDSDDSETEVAPGKDVLGADDLLSDEDRVLRLIRENGGRMKQVKIVEETGWSKSKVSMLLSDMETNGSISKLRVGRENIISLEGFEPEATKSPFDE
jgi:hypothetical protein